MGKHALLNASSAHRWLTCPPLPRLENFFYTESAMNYKII
jgi:hypothetical protein